MRELTLRRRAVVEQAKTKRLCTDPNKLFGQRCGALEEFMVMLEELIADETNLGVSRIRTLFEAELPWCKEMFEQFVEEMMEKLSPAAKLAAQASQRAELFLGPDYDPALQPEAILKKVLVAPSLYVMFFECRDGVCAYECALLCVCLPRLLRLI